MKVNLEGMRVIAVSSGNYGSGKTAWKAGREYMLYKGPNGTRYLFVETKEAHNFKRGIGLVYTWDSEQSIKGLFRKA